jgi:glycosyltransferase involved in cell wall biosynthesis
MPSKIVLVMPQSSLSGGSDFALISLLESEFRNNVKEVIFFESGPLEELIKKIGINTKIMNFSRLLSFQFIWVALKAKIQYRKDAELIFFAWMSKASLFVRFVGGSRLCITYYHEFPFRNSLERLTFIDKQTVRFFCSDLVQSEFKQIYKFKSSFVISPPLFNSRLKKITSIKLDSKDSPVISIGTISRLERWKKLEDLILVSKLMKDNGFRMRVTIAGGASKASIGYKEELIELAHKINVINDCVFLGEIDFVEEVLNSLDVFINTSPQEPFGLNLVEAAFMKVPIIATKFCGAGQKFHEIDACSLYDAGNVVDLFSKIVDTVENIETSSRVERAYELAGKLDANGFVKSFQIALQKLELKP